MDKELPGRKSCLVGCDRRCLILWGPHTTRGSFTGRLPSSTRQRGGLDFAGMKIVSILGDECLSWSDKWNFLRDESDGRRACSAVSGTRAMVQDQNREPPLRSAGPLGKLFSCTKSLCTCGLPCPRGGGHPRGAGWPRRNRIGRWMRPLYPIPADLAMAAPSTPAQTTIQHPSQNRPARSPRRSDRSRISHPHGRLRACGTATKGKPTHPLGNSIPNAIFVIASN